MKRILAAAALLFLGLAMAAAAQTQTGGAGGVTSITCNGTTITTSGNCGALTGDVTASAGSGATTVGKIGGVSVGTGATTNTGTSGATIPLNSTANIFSAFQTVNLNAAAPPSAITGTALQVFNVDGVSGRLVAGSFGAIANVTVARADGTGASPTQVLSGEQIGGINSYAYGSGGWQGPIVSYRSYAAENIDSTHYGSKACIATTPLASTTMADVFCALGDGTLQINGNGIFGSTAAATFRHGGLDAASPVAQTIKFQDVVAGASNIAGVNATIQAPAGTGTGAGGSLVFQVAPAGSTGTAKNAWVTTLTLDSALGATFAGGVTASGNISAGAAFLNSARLNGTAGFVSVNNDSFLTRVATANLRVGNASSATPAANTLTIGESSRSGTDTNVSGANGTIQSGNGTGNAAVSGVTIQAPTAVASGTGAQTQTNVAVFKTTGVTITPGIIAGGSPPTLTGTCATTTQVGGNTAGSFVTSAGCSATTVIITFAATAPNGWVCDASDETTPADSLKQTGHSTTSCTLTGTTAAADVIVFHANAF